LPEIVTVPDGLAARVPVKAEPSDIDTEAAATVVPAAALSGRDAASRREHADYRSGGLPRASR
jgi:hypothetical protein